MDSITNLPLGKVEVVAEHVAGHDPGASTTTDAKGNFLIIDIDPGEYHVAVRRNGYLDSHYGAKRPSGTGSAILLTAGQNMKDLRIKLVPFGVISGALRDADGEPILDENINVYRSFRIGTETRMLFVRNRQTDELGQYHIVDRPPGKYYVTAVYGGRSGLVDHSAKSTDRPEIPVTTFYPGTTDPAFARPVDVGAGSRVSGVDFAVVRSRMYRIGVHVDTAPGLRASARLTYSVDGLYPAGGVFEANSDGNLEISGVPPGSYKVQIFVK